MLKRAPGRMAVSGETPVGITMSYEVDRARRSNETIIFKMGHNSVAEHAVFNFDVIGLSRLAIEELERFLDAALLRCPSRPRALDRHVPARPAP